MNLMTYGRVLGRDHNVVRVDFRRKPDPPAPKFPGANGLRRINNCEPDDGGEILLAGQRFLRAS